MNIYTPKEKSLWGELLGVLNLVLLIFVIVSGLTIFSKLTEKMSKVAEAQIITGEFLESYIPEVEKRFELLNYKLRGHDRDFEADQYSIETLARETRELLDWKMKTCFTTCGRAK